MNEDDLRRDLEQANHDLVADRTRSLSEVLAELDKQTRIRRARAYYARMRRYAGRPLPWSE